MPRVQSTTELDTKAVKKRTSTRVAVRKSNTDEQRAFPPKRRHRTILKTGSWLLVLTVIFFILLNWGYVTARVAFFFFSPNASEVIKPAAQTATKPGEGAWPKNVLAIPSLGVNVPVVYISETGEEAFQNALAGGVVHYPGSSLPGEVGNVYIFGHSSDYAWSKGNYKHAFALLPKIKHGAEIKLTDDKGFAYTYLVKEQRVVGPRDVAVLGQNTNGRKLLTLQTSYPLGTALKRYVVVAELRQSD